MRRIAVVTYAPFPAPIGLTRRIQGIIAVLVACGWSVSLIAPEFETRKSREGKFQLTRIRSYFTEPGGWISRTIAHLVYLFRLSFYLFPRAKYYDVIQLEHQYAAFMIPFLKRLSSARVVVDDFIFVSTYVQGISAVLFHALEAIAIRNADLVVTASAFAAHHLSKMGINPIIAPNGVEVDETPSEDKLRHGFVLVGALSFMQNLIAVRHLIKAVRKLVALKIFPEVKVIGGPNNIANQLQKDVSQFNLPIEFTGRVPDSELRKILRSARIGMLPFFEDSPLIGGQRIKALEYLAHGLLVLSGPHGVAGMGGMVDGKNCIKAPDIERFAEAMGKLMTSWSSYKHIALTGKQFARDSLSWRRVTSDYIAWIQNMGV